MVRKPKAKTSNSDANAKKIVNELVKNPKATNAELARKIGVSEETVRRRLNAMVEAGVLGYGIAFDPKNFGYERSEVAIVTPAPEQDLAVLYWLRKLTGVTHAISALTDNGPVIMVELQARDRNDLMSVFNNFNNNDGITGFSRFEILDNDYMALTTATSEETL